MNTTVPKRMEPEHVETVVIGAGQAGLSAGYELARRGRPFLILNAHDRVGDQWRNRWDSLRLFTPAAFNGLNGLPFPADRGYFPTKDEMAAYLESYAAHFDLPVRSGVRVERLTREAEGFALATSVGRLTADNVIVAMGSYQQPRLPRFAADLDASIVQLHSREYRNPAQLQDGPVLLVGAGNSAAEIAIDVASTHETWVAGRDVGGMPFRIEGWLGRRFLVRFVLRGIFHRVLTVSTPVGRKVRPKLLTQGGPLVRTRSKELAAAGVHRVGRVARVRNGFPVLDDGRTLEVANVIWCTGFTAGFEWIDLPVLGGHEPLHNRGIATGQPGLYFVGLHFQTSLSSGMVHGVGRDAEHVVAHLDRQAKRAEPVAVAAKLGTTVAAWLPRS